MQAERTRPRGRNEYRAYLLTPEWKAKRKAALSRAGNRCQLCNGSDRLQVHHRTYERVGNEDPGDLTVLCNDCHETFHGIGTPQPAPAKKRPKARRSRPQPQRKKKGPSKQASKKLREVAEENDRLHRIQVLNRARQEAARSVFPNRFR